MISGALEIFEQSWSTPANVLNILTLMIALASFFSVLLAKRAVDKTHKNTQAQIVMTLLDDYASQEMRDAITKLWDQKTRYGNDYMTEFRKRRSEDSDWDRSRRFVAHYYQKVAALYDKGLLDREFAVVVATKEQVEFYTEVIEPLEVVVNPDYGTSTFTILETLHKPR